MAKNCFEKNETTPEQLGLPGIMKLPKEQMITRAQNFKDIFAKGKVNAKLQDIKNVANSEYVLGHSRGAAKGLEAVIVKDLRGKGENISIETRADTVLGMVHGKINDFLQKYTMKRVGFAQDKGGMRNLMKELLGTKTGDADASSIAAAVKEQFEYLRIRFNAAGGNIKSLEDWGLTQHHDARKVGSVAQDQWVADIFPHLNTRRMAKQMGDPEMSDDMVKDIVAEIYHTIRTDGINKIVPGKFPPGARRALSQKHAERRILHFKDGEKWLDYQDKYGRPDMFQSLNTHLEIMSKDIAAMEVLGPNPDAGLAFLSDVVTKSTASSGKPSRRQPDWANKLYDTFMGRNRTEPNKLGDILGATRNVLVSARLGSAMLSAIGDYAFLNSTAAYNKVPVMKTMARYLKNLSPASAEDRKTAARLGLIAESAISDMTAANRFSEVVGTGVAAKLSNVVMRASGLKAHTDAARRAFQIEYLAMLSDNTGKTYELLHPKIKRQFKAKGITASDWEVLRKSKKLRRAGNSFIDPYAISDNDLVVKLNGLVMDETDMAVPTPDVRIRTITTLGTKQGTVAGETARTTMQFKTFPISVLVNHGSRGVWGTTGMEKMTYMTSMVSVATMLGAVAMAAKDISKGKDPKDMDSPEFWAAAMMQGGGLGLMGDFLFADHNRYGSGVIPTLGGPAGDTIEATRRLLFGTAQSVIQGEKTTAAKQAVNLGVSLVPGQSLWYARLAMERYMFDHMRKLADPDYGRNQRRKQRKMKTETGQEYFWKPGKVAPRRAPKVPEPIKRATMPRF